jgi:small subunit ribosomal protein S2
MGGVPDLLFVIDTNKEAIAIDEARRLNIPVAAVVDSNCDPDNITYVIPGNDDAGRAINLYCDLVARAAIDGISRAQGEAGIDIGAQDQVHESVVLDAAPPTADVDMAAAPAVEPEGADVATKPKRSRQVLKPIFETPAGTPDDLKKIEGIGPVVESKLRSLGVTKYDQIANFSEDDFEKIDKALNFKGRLAVNDWRSQARALAAEA